MTATDDQLLLDEIYRDTCTRIHSLLLDRCGSRPLAEDITAQTYEAAARHVRAGRGAEVTIAWLTTVAKRRLVDHWRSEFRRDRMRRRVLTEMAPGGGVHAGGVHEAGIHGDDPDDRVGVALDALPGRHRVALTLRYVDGWSVDELAEALGLSYQAAQSLLARARRSFRAALEEGPT